MNTDTASTLLDQQQQQLDALLVLLRQELAALAERDITRLENITADKNQLLSNIGHTDRAISLLPDLEQVKLLDWFTAAVTKLDAVLADCKQQNDVNQQVLEQSQLTLDRFKNTLLAQQGKSGLTYTNKGKPAIDNIGKGVKA
jgi:flagellar biosynthesis protein FlgN